MNKIPLGFIPTYNVRGASNNIFVPWQGLVLKLLSGLLAIGEQSCGMAKKMCLKTR